MSAYIPERGDAVEAWLEQWRDRYEAFSPRWAAVVDLLNDFWMHADWTEGVPLDQETPTTVTMRGGPDLDPAGEREYDAEKAEVDQ